MSVTHETGPGSSFAVGEGRAPQSHDDAGVTLILALIFLVAISMTLLALLNLSTTNLVSSSNLQSQASLEYSADGVTDSAVQWVRYGSVLPGHSCQEGTPFCLYLFDYTASGSGLPDTTPGGSPTTPAACLPQGVTFMTLGGGPRIAVYCLNDGEASSTTSALRGVFFYACSASQCVITANGSYFLCTSSGCLPEASPPPGASPPILEADVQFNDYSASIAGQVSYGSQMTIRSWVIETANS